MSRKYLYRVTAYHSKKFWPDRPPHEWTSTRCYQSRGAAEHRAAVLREGRPADVEWDGSGKPAIQAADRVVIERSGPVDGWTPLSESSRTSGPAGRRWSE